MESRTQCQIKISAVDSLFPGTADRIILLGGAMQGLEACLEMLLQRLHEGAVGSGRPVRVKLAVPNSAVSALIGPGGSVARELSSSTGCRLHVSPRVANLRERVVWLSGAHGSVAAAASQVCQVVQGDPRLAEHLFLRYEEEIPLGAWVGAEVVPFDPAAVPMTSAQLAQATSETWLARGGDPASALAQPAGDAAPAPAAGPSGAASEATTGASGSAPRSLPPQRQLAPPSRDEDSDVDLAAGPPAALELQRAHSAARAGGPTTGPAAGRTPAASACAAACLEPRSEEFCVQLTCAVYPKIGLVLGEMSQTLELEMPPALKESFEELVFDVLELPLSVCLFSSRIFGAA